MNVGPFGTQAPAKDNDNHVMALDGKAKNGWLETRKTEVPCCN